MAEASYKNIRIYFLLYPPFGCTEGVEITSPLYFHVLCEKLDFNEQSSHLIVASPLQSMWSRLFYKVDMFHGNYGYNSVTIASHCVRFYHL